MNKRKLRKIICTILVFAMMLSFAPMMSVLAVDYEYENPPVVDNVIIEDEYPLVTDEAVVEDEYENPIATSDVIVEDGSENLPVTNEAILELPISMFRVFGDTMDRGKIVAQVSDGTTFAGATGTAVPGGVFIAWRYFPSESIGPNDDGTGMAGTNFVIYRNLVRITENPITNSTNFHDRDGTVSDSYIVVTVDGVTGAYLSRTYAANPFPLAAQAGGTAGAGATLASRGYYIPVPLARPDAVLVPSNFRLNETVLMHYYPNEVKVGILDDSGQFSFVVEWITGNPDVIQGSAQAPVIYRAYTLTGEMLWEVNLGWNIRPGQHYSVPMLYDFDGDGIYELIVKTAPGTVDGLGNYITMSAGSIAAGYSHQDRFQADDGARWRTAERMIRNLPDSNNAGTAATALTPAVVDAADPAVVAAAAAVIEEGTRFQTLVRWFMGWNEHQEVTGRQYWGNPTGEIELTWLEGEDREAVEGVQIGWWVQPPQVMMGIYQLGYVCPLTGEVARVNGAMYRFGGPYQTGAGLNHLANPMTPASQRRAPGWNEATFNLLNNLPKCPVAFRRIEITEEIATALTWQLLQNSFARDNNNAQNVNNQRNYGGMWGVINWNGYIQNGPEYMTVFSGRDGSELDTIPFVVPREDMGQMWNDFTFFRFEPDNRVERHQAAVGYLDGRGENASKITIRGYYSRLSITRYDWDGENLTGELITDSGFEVFPNPFNARPKLADGTFAFNGWTHMNTHGSPGRWEAAFHPDHLMLFCFERIGANGVACQDECFRTSFTLQGQQSMNVMDVDSDGRDEINVGGAMFNHDGSLRWSAWYRYFTAGSQQTVPGGGWQKVGHGDWMVTGFFTPDHSRPVTWASFEGSMLDSALIDADDGTVIFIDQPGGGTVGNPTWGNFRDTQRGIAGDFTSEPGWQFFNNRALWHTPFGPATGGGMWTINQDGEDIGWWSPNGFVVGGATRGLQIPGTGSIDNQLFWSGDLTTAVATSGGGGHISRAVPNAAGTAYVVQRAMTGQGNQALHWGQAAFIADVFGDFREEFGLLANVGTGAFTGPGAVYELRIYFNTEESEHRLFSLQTDRRYRVEAARYNTGYNIATVPGFYLGRDMDFDMYWSVYQAQATETFNPFATLNVAPPVEFTGTNPNTLRGLLAEEHARVDLATRGNLGIFTQHSPFVIPAGRTLTVTTTLNISGNAELIVEGVLIVAEGGRINNQGSSGGTITVAPGGLLINEGWVENVTNSTFDNNGTIINNGRFEVRAGVTFYDRGDVKGANPLNINRNATVIEIE
ncbi:MAG: hypothetical protein FWD05_02110 [Oscillospiraceae bacterium]|nr:hypothetical protein [Oscillospiraceae bacterium]